MVERFTRRYGSGWEALPKGRVWSGKIGRHSRRDGGGREWSGGPFEGREWSGVPSRGPGVVGRPSR